VASLREKLQAGEKSLIGNKGYRRYLCSSGPDHFQIDEAKMVEEARSDGKWVLRTNTELDAAEVALQYKWLWIVESYFHSCKSLLQTRPIYHKCDETIRGHVFCSFLAMVLRQELEARLDKRGEELEWADVIPDLDRLQMAEVGQDDKRFLLRSEVQVTCGWVFQAVGVAVPPTVQRVAPLPHSQESGPSATPPV
jgi:transposase